MKIVVTVRCFKNDDEEGSACVQRWSQCSHQCDLIPEGSLVGGKVSCDSVLNCSPVLYSQAWVRKTEYHLVEEGCSLHSSQEAGGGLTVPFQSTAQ